MKTTLLTITLILAAFSSTVHADRESITTANEVYAECIARNIQAHPTWVEPLRPAFDKNHENHFVIKEKLIKMMMQMSESEHSHCYDEYPEGQLVFSMVTYNIYMHLYH